MGVLQGGSKGENMNLRVSYSACWGSRRAGHTKERAMVIPMPRSHRHPSVSCRLTVTAGEKRRDTPPQSRKLNAKRTEWL